jgi:hypothetical protein
MAAACAIVAGFRTHLDNSNYRDIILSGNAHYSSLRPFSVTAVSTALADIPTCREFPVTNFSSMYCS